MRQFILILLIALLLATTSQQAQSGGIQSGIAQVTVSNTTGKDCFFQREGTSGYTRVELDTKGKHTFQIELAAPAYYQYTDGKQQFHVLYLTPGSKTEITETSDSVSLRGDHAAINAFINQHRYLGYSDKQVPMHSAEWQKNCVDELDKLCYKLDESGLPADFIKRHKLYYRFAYYAQQLNSPGLTATFTKTKVVLAGHYYDFLKDIQFSDVDILSIPKWFNILNAALGEMEKQGMLPVAKDRYMQIYANRIENGQVRSAFLVQLLELTLQKGYSDCFPTYLESIKDIPLEDRDKAQLKEVTAKYEKLKEVNKGILRGNAAPEFTAMDVDGKVYRMSDFAGKVVVLDFWFTGCIPCKAEMPFMEQIAETMKGEPIQFISMSLDSGNQLIAGWKAMVKGKQGMVLNLNIPQGFKSDLAQKYGIRSVPRIVIIDQEGKIYDSNTLRPSDPKLKLTLEALLGKGNVKEEIRKEMMALMRVEKAAQKDSIFRNATARFRQVPEVAPMLNMMLYQVMISSAKEKRYAPINAYLKDISPSEFRRDLVFLIGNACMENGDSPEAEPFLKEAAETTVEYAEKKPDDKDEQDKIFITAKLYGILLAEQDRLTEAEEWIDQAYNNGGQTDFPIMRAYVAVRLSKKEYDKAFPVLETIFKRGMGSDDLKAQLKMAYLGKNGSDKGFNNYLEGILKESADNEKKKVQDRMVNEPAPLFTLKNMEGEDVSLASLKGKVVVLDFWATWCGPCKSSFPGMQKAVDKYQDKNVVFLFIDTWENTPTPESVVKTFIEKHGYHFNVLFDLKNPVSKKCEVIESYGAKGVPAKYIIDKGGNIRFRLVGFSGSEEQVVNELSGMIDLLL